MSKESSYKSDKELEDLLRKIADSAEIPFSKEDWGDMKARLDELPNPTPTAAWWRKKRMVWGGVVFMGLLISVALWNFLPVTQVTDQAANGPEVPIQHAETKGENNEPTVRAGGDDAKATVEEITIPTGGSTRSSKVSPPLSSGYTGAVGSTALSPGGSNSELQGMSVWTDQETLPFRWEGNQIPPLDYNLSLPGSLVIPEDNPITGDKAEGDQVEKEKKSYRYAGRFSLSVQAAPDLSGIKLNQVEKAGNAIGIGAAYFLSPRLSLSSGIFYSFKPYRSEGEVQYGSTDEPDWIFGECDILDIPFNLRYYPLEGKLQRAFVSVGLSSYLMLKEHYELEYGSGTGYPYTKEIDVSGENNHFFGVVNISAGYERKLGNQLSVQVEPYFKVPISGVGEGDISLKSTGLFVGLNFYPGKKK